jgi:hypothetical protein
VSTGEQGQGVLCAVCRPACQQAMTYQVEQTAAVDSHKTLISGQSASLKIYTTNSLTCCRQPGADHHTLTSWLQ